MTSKVIISEYLMCPGEGVLSVNLGDYSSDNRFLNDKEHYAIFRMDPGGPSLFTI